MGTNMKSLPKTSRLPEDIQTKIVYVLEAIFGFFELKEFNRLTQTLVIPLSSLNAEMAEAKWIVEEFLDDDIVIFKNTEILESMSRRKRSLHDNISDDAYIKLSNNGIPINSVRDVQTNLILFIKNPEAMLLQIDKVVAEYKKQDKVLETNNPQINHSNSNYHIVHESDSYFYQGTDLKIRKTDNYGMTFAVLHKLNPYGGLCKYEEYEKAFKGEYSVTHKKYEDEFRRWSQRNLTENSKGVLARTHSGLIVTEEGVGFRYNNKI
ncbi:MAG: hypothetical protein ACI9UJ_001680 [bacterium]|jgi:hypothetical protein